MVFEQPLEALNYHHLRYFWAAVREGGVTRASRKLSISQPTVSSQIRALEDRLGEKLTVRQGRQLALTEAGRIVFRYAEEIFNLGRELVDTLKDRPGGRPARLTVGIDNAVPKLVAHRLLQPALQIPEPVRIECFEDKSERLVAELAVHALDIVLSDAPMPLGTSVRAYSHLLGESGVGLYAAPRLADERRAGFPASLDGAPLLLPTRNSGLRRALDQWLEERKLRPRIACEIEDAALLEVFGRAGVGVFPGCLAIERELLEQYRAERIGIVEGVRERFYAISVERRIKHPAVLAISEQARASLFA
ncbi:MAG TPA: transcriptional activator NhaR [Vicinamibacteria bacterium]|nr:transcriptional activator NhaR [Vicinamibacteria bacterium]